MVGIEVLNQDEGQAGIEGKVIQQLSKSFQPAGRRSDAHHRDHRYICPWAHVPLSVADAYPRPTAVAYHNRSRGQQGCCHG